MLNVMVPFMRNEAASRCPEWGECKHIPEFSHLSLNQSSRYYCDSLPFLEVHVEKLSIKQGSQTERNNKRNIARASVATSLAILRFALIKLSVISKHRK